MLINFKKENAGILNVPLQPSEEEMKKREASPERAAHANPKFISLVPGMNDIPDAKWNKIRNNDRIKAYLASGEMVLPWAETIPAKKEGGSDKELTTKEFRVLAGAEQEVLIKDCDQIALLEKWKAYAKESSRALLIDKLERLKNPEKYTEEDED